MKILVAQIDPTIGDFKGNVEKILHSLESARKKKADVVLFSELVICGYPPEDLLMHRGFVEECEKALQQVIVASKGLFVVVGTVRFTGNGGEKPIHNSAAIVSDGKLVGYHDKWLLPTYDVFDEMRFFEPGQRVQVWPYRGKKIGVLICEDIWQHAGVVGYTHYKRDPVVELKKLGVDLLLNLTASPYHFDKPDMRARVCFASAKTVDAPVIMCCQVGGNDQLVFDGYSLYASPQGELLQIAKGFEEDEMLVDLDRSLPPCQFHYDPIGDLYHALVLGMRDYFYKQGFKRGCLGLSGGVDSALVACIAVDALGHDNVLALSMPSRFSSQGSKSDAELLARNLNIKLLQIPIEAPFQTYLELLEPQFKQKPFDVTEENIQARIRGMILMALSNKFGYIVLSTGNKSELAMGYCTLYGDMCGGLSVISDLTKAQIYALCQWVNKKGDVIPQSVIDKPPSAELKEGQKDSDTLPSYPVLDAVLHGYVEEFLSPEEIAKRSRIDLVLVKEIIHKIHLAEYKRRQGAPGIRVSRKSFMVGRRYPIVQKWY